MDSKTTEQIIGSCLGITVMYNATIKALWGISNYWSKDLFYPYGSRQTATPIKEDQEE